MSSNSDGKSPNCLFHAPRKVKKISRAINTEKTTLFYDSDYCSAEFFDLTERRHKPVSNRECKSLTAKGVAPHADPESCVCIRKGAGEALTGARAGQVLSRERKIDFGRPP
jgi:hypothetical protein